jgi:hypothetical protein
MQDLGGIESSSSEWAAPIVLLPKPDGYLRFCIDYQKLSELTVRDSYPLPPVSDCMDSLGSANISSTLDANSGFWQLEMAEADKDKTNFTSHRGTYRFTLMPFGLCNAPATFRRALDVLLSRVLWKSAIVYFHDIIIFSSTVKDHIRDFDEVPSILKDTCVRLNLRKCAFFKADWPRPRSKTELRSFIAFCSLYRRFIAGFAGTAASLMKS